MEERISKYGSQEEISERVEKLLSGMTIHEKAGQLNQAGTTMICALPGIEADIGKWVTDMMEGRLSEAEFQKRIAMCEENLKLDEVERGEIGSFVNLYEDGKVARVLEAGEKSRLGITPLIGVDIIRGYRTLFPTPLAMSCAWDTEMHRKMIRVAKREAHISGANWVFGPMLDIARDARWGRIVESPGEDPLLASDVARAMVDEYHKDEDGGPMMCTAKHFLAYGAVSGGQDYYTVSVSKQQLYETYLPPFRAAVRAGVDSVMSAFHDLNGIPCTCDKELLDDLLRKELGFDGFVCSDAEAIRQLVPHGTAGDEREAAKLALMAGNDVDMSSYCYQNYLEDLVRTGEVPMEVLDRSVRRVLRKKAEYGILDETYVYDPEKIREAVLTKENRERSLETALHSVVLLKNEDNILPIRPEARRILVVGELAEDKEALTGPWAFTGDGSKTVTILEGIRSRAPEGTEILYCKGFGVHDNKDGFQEALEEAGRADFVIAVAGETAFMSGEASSRADLRLAGAQEEFLAELGRTGVPAAVLLVNGRPLAIGSLQNDPGIGAILETWHLGTEAGNAIAAVLFGDFNPSGKLTTTWANCAGQEPMYYNHPNTGKPGGEFKFTSKYQDTPIRPLYPFGFGLSYTTFTYDDLRLLDCDGKEIVFTVSVTNTGNRSGEEIVQAYIHRRKGKIVPPVKELKAYRKILLMPDETVKCELRIAKEDLGYYDREGRYCLEEGWFDLLVGKNSKDVLEAEFWLKIN